MNRKTEGEETSDLITRESQTLADGIEGVRDSVCALMRTRRREVRRKKQTLVEVQCSIVGTAWCAVSDRYLVTAHHVLNEGKAPQEGDRYYAFIVPHNGPTAHHISVTGVSLSEPTLDLAVVEVVIPPGSGLHLTAIPLLGHRPPDGSRVLTYGFPAPEIAKAVVGPDGSYLGGQMFLKGHANEGIIAAQYEVGGSWHYEFNVGWHHGESGGPVVLESEGAAFAVMQGYRNVKSPHGVFAGPHGGRSLEGIRDALRDLGATLI